jgi:hypothetical protein
MTDNAILSTVLDGMAGATQTGGRWWIDSDLLFEADDPLPQP